MPKSRQVCRAHYSSNWAIASRWRLAAGTAGRPKASTCVVANGGREAQAEVLIRGRLDLAGSLAFFGSLICMYRLLVS